jgi:hypothetical protein
MKYIPVIFMSILGLIFVGCSSNVGVGGAACELVMYKEFTNDLRNIKDTPAKNLMKRLEFEGETNKIKKKVQKETLEEALHELCKNFDGDFTSRKGGKGGVNEYIEAELKKFDS